MEALEFLGGKYQKPELIVSGPVQTFRARDSVTSRFVFAHRVSMTEESVEQTALLRLLTTALVRSPEVRKLVLDFGDEQGFWYAVTQPEPQCILLRQWLQSELDALDTGAQLKKPAGKPAEETPFEAKPAGPEATPPSAKTPEISSFAPAEPPKPPAPKPPAPKPAEPKSELGEFTRMFRASSQQPDKPVVPAGHPQAAEVPAAPEPPKPEPPKPEPPKAESPKPEEPTREPGEFTRMFQASSPGAAKTPPAPQPSQAADGEFTRFFQGGLPPSQKATPSSPPSGNGGQDRPSGSGGQERPSRGGGFVQRPNTPMPPSAQKASDPGEFTRLFSTQGPESAKPNTSAPDLFNQSGARSDAMPELSRGAGKGSSDLFEVEQRKSVSEGPGEYTKIFGSGTAAPPQQPSSTAEPPQAPLVEDSHRATRPITSIPVTPPPVSKGPSEYTMILQGNRPPEGGAAPVANAAAPDQAGAAKPFPNLTAPPIAPLKGLHPPPVVPAAHASPAKLPKPPQMPAAANAAKLAAGAVPAAGSPNKKLILLLVILGVLAIVLVVLVALVFNKK